MEEKATGEKKPNKYWVRTKAAGAEIWTAFKGLSMDAKIIVCGVLALLIIALCIPGSGSSSSSTENADAGKMCSDAVSSLKASYQEGLNKAKNDSEVQKSLKEASDAANKLGETVKGLGF